MASNRIAVFGHRGWASSAIVQALADAVPRLKVLHRLESEAGERLPSNATAIAVDIENKRAVADALQDVDILISLVGHEGVKRQHDLLEAIPLTNVELFVPSDLAFRCDGIGTTIPIVQAKREVVEAARKLNIPIATVLPGNMVESSMATTMLGIDVARNRIAYTGASDRHPNNFCTRAYVAAGYASIFAHTPAAALANRAIGLSEFLATGREIACALERRHGVAPEIYVQSLEEADGEIEGCVRAGSPLALAWYCRRVWGEGGFPGAVGAEVWDVPGREKVGLEELVVRGEMGRYRGLPERVVEMFDGMFEKCVRRDGR